MKIKMRSTSKTLDKINIDASKRHSEKTTLIEYISIDNQDNIIMAKVKQIGDYLMLVAVCVAVREAMVVAVQKILENVII